MMFGDLVYEWKSYLSTLSPYELAEQTGNVMPSALGRVSSATSQASDDWHATARNISPKNTGGPHAAERARLAHVEKGQRLERAHTSLSDRHRKDGDIDKSRKHEKQAIEIRAQLTAMGKPYTRTAPGNPDVVAQMRTPKEKLGPKAAEVRAKAAASNRVKRMQRRA